MKANILLNTARFAGVLALTLAGCPAADNSGPIKTDNHARVATTPEQADEMADQVIALVNAIRLEHGVKPLRKSAVLTKLAEAYAEHMIEKGYFSHIDPATGERPGQRALAAGYLFLSVGENLGAGQTSPEAVVDDWMSSTQGHRENALSPQWDEVGVAVRTGGEHGVYWVMEFGNPP